MDLDAFMAAALAAIESSDDERELEQARVEYLGRRSALALALREVRDRESGIPLNAARRRLVQSVAARRDALRSLAADRRAAEPVVDVSLPGVRFGIGRLHPLTRARRRIEALFLGMGYDVRDDREVLTVAQNFDDLAFAPDHPARTSTASYYLKNGAVLRSGAAASQVLAMRESAPPIYAVSIGRCYRRDRRDSAHVDLFLQVVGFAIDIGLSLAHLRGTLELVVRELLGSDCELRFRSTYNPFTSPSVEPAVRCQRCDGRGCPTCKRSGWLEMGGGMIDPAVLRVGGCDPNVVSGFSFGLGIERTLVVERRMPDLRILWETDLSVLRAI